jgi:hypothetical protein
MRFHKLFLFPLVCAALVVFVGSAHSATVILPFTGGDAGEGLDLSGAFVYAIDIDGAGRESAGYQVGDAFFTGDETTPGFTMTPTDRQDNSPVVFGDTADDNNLESVTSTGAWVSGDDNPPSFSIDMTVESGQEYLLQLMIVEGWNATAPGIRVFNVSVEDELIAADFDATAIAGVQNVVDGAGETNAGAAIIHSFTATDNVLNVQLTHGPVNNPRIEALTLKMIPEPSGIVLTVLGVMTLLGLRRFQ